MMGTQKAVDFKVDDLGEYIAVWIGNEDAIKASYEAEWKPILEDVRKVLALGFTKHAFGSLFYGYPQGVAKGKSDAVAFVLPKFLAGAMAGYVGESSGK